jgi:endonuclease VIII
VPEGHTVHRLARDHQRDLGGRPVRAGSPQGRFAEGAARVDGRVPERFEAYGKHELAHLDSGEVLHVHLGLIGKWRRQRAPASPPFGMVRLRLEGEAWAWDLSGPITCRLITPDEAAAVMAALGPDPLRPDADPQRFVDRVRRSTAPIGALLLDQTVIAGIGNVYRAEVLWAFGVDPRRPGRSVDADQLLAMWEWFRHQMRLGVKRNRIVTTDTPAGRGAYHQEACIRCGGPVTTLAVAGRRIEACPTCQT